MAAFCASRRSAAIRITPVAVLRDDRLPLWRGIDYHVGRDDSTSIVAGLPSAAAQWCSRAMAKASGSSLPPPRLGNRG